MPVSPLRSLLQCALLGSLTTSVLAAPPRDFNGDGFDDLAVGARERVANQFRAGAVHTILGSSTGLTAAGDKQFHQNTDGVADEPEPTEHLGDVLAVGDFNGDGFSDLAVGVSPESVLDAGTNSQVERAGAVHVFFGGPSGPSANGSQFLHRNVVRVAGRAEVGENFGCALAAGDFNADGFDDLAVGVLGQEVEGVAFAGAVHVFYGGNLGLKTTNDEIWDRSSPGIERGPGNIFGIALAAGDFDGNGADDLAIGSRDNNAGAGLFNVGAVNVIYGTPSVGLTAERDQFFDQDSPGIRDQCEDGDFWGEALASGDFNADGFDDLAVGSVLEDLGADNSIFNAGGVNVIYGTANGLHSRRNQFITEQNDGLPTGPQAGAFFGESLAAGDFDGDGRDDLAIGVRGKTIDGVVSAGAVAVLYGGNRVLLTSRSQRFHQGTPGIPGDPDELDRFGFSLATGDFNGDGFADLVVSAPTEDVNGVSDAGTITVIFGSPSGLTGAGAQLFSQETPGILDTAEADDEFGTGLSNG